MSKHETNKRLKNKRKINSQKKYEEAKNYLDSLVVNNRSLNLEYDQYQDDSL